MSRIISELREEYDEEMVDVECDREERKAEQSEEARLADYERRLQLDLERKLKRMEYDKKCDEIRERFEKEHAEEYDKIKKHESESFLEERVYSCDMDSDVHTKKWLDDAQLFELKAKYKNLETRQIEILDICTSKDEVQNWASGQLEALINEYLASEKLKLILVDRIKSNICKHDLDFGVHTFGGNHMEISADVKYDPTNNHYRRVR